MTFEDWKASARRIQIDDFGQGPDILEYFSDEIPGTELMVFGQEQSWLVIVPKDDGEAYHVVAPRWSDEVADYDEAVAILWDQHARYEQNDVPSLS